MFSMEQVYEEKRKAGIRTFLCVLVLAVLFLLLILRVPYGYDWTDESDYLALPYRLLMFDRPLVDTWEVHQLSALITLPLVAFYRAVNGAATDGLLLFTRYCFVAMQFLISLYAFFVLRRRYGNAASLLAAALFLGYTHFSINSLYYNTYALLFLTLSVLLALEARAAVPLSGWRFALSGLLFALSVQAQPYTLLAVLVWVGWFIPLMRSGKAGRRAFWCWIGGAVLVALLFAAYVAFRSPLGEIPANVRGMLSDPSYPKISYAEEMLKYLNAIRVIFSPFSYAAAALLLLGGWYALTKNERSRRILRIAGLALALMTMAGATAIAAVRNWSDIYRLNTVAMAFALSAPGLYLLGDRKPGGAGALFLFGAALSIATQFGSNTRILASSGMLVLGSMSAVLFLFENLKNLPGKEGAQNGRRAGRVAFSAALFICALGAGTVFWYRVTAVHRDEPLPKLTQTIQAGPAKGIRTTPEHAAQYEQLVSDIRQNAPEKGNILVSNLFPDSYLLTDLVPAAPGEFNMSVEFISAYYTQHPERLPDYLYAIDASYGRDNAASYEITAELMKGGRFEAYPQQSGTAYRKAQGE